jgi:hypothetical protein
MPFQLTDRAKLQEIQNAYNNKNWTKTYELIYNAVNVSGVDGAALLWIGGAMKVISRLG